MSRTLSTCLLACLGAALACASPEPPSRERLIRDLIQQRSRADTRPDSFTAAADRGRILGDSTAALWLVIVGDFQCEDCRRWHDLVFPALRNEYVATGKVRMAFVSMPQDAHLNAVASSLAAGCASSQGRFWETAERIFDTQNRWMDLPDARPFLDSLAIDAGADPATQRLCTERARAMKLIRQDAERSAAAGVVSLPTFFIGKHTVIGTAAITTFRAVIDSALAGR